MLRALMKEVDNMQLCKQEKWKFKKEPKGNAASKKCCN